MNKLLAEFIGTALLIVLGDGVVANVVLNKSKGHNSGWMVIATGWGLAVALSVYCVGGFSGGHLNPAVTIAMATIWPHRSSGTPNTTVPVTPLHNSKACSTSAG